MKLNDYLRNCPHKINEDVIKSDLLQIKKIQSTLDHVDKTVFGFELFSKVKALNFTESNITDDVKLLDGIAQLWGNLRINEGHFVFNEKGEFSGCKYGHPTSSCPDKNTLVKNICSCLSNKYIVSNLMNADILKTESIFIKSIFEMPKLPKETVRNLFTIEEAVALVKKHSDGINTYQSLCTVFTRDFDPDSNEIAINALNGFLYEYTKSHKQIHPLIANVPTRCLRPWESVPDLMVIDRINACSSTVIAQNLCRNLRMILPQEQRIRIFDKVVVNIEDISNSLAKYSKIDSVDKSRGFFHVPYRLREAAEIRHNIEDVSFILSVFDVDKLSDKSRECLKMLTDASDDILICKRGHYHSADFQCITSFWSRWMFLIYPTIEATMDECDNHPRVISLRKAYTNSLTTTGSIITKTIMNAITGNFLDIQSILGGSIIVDIVMGGNITNMKKVDRANNLAERITDVGLDKITRHLEPTE